MPTTALSTITGRAANERIAHVLKGFLKRKNTRRLIVAGGTTPPPQLAYLVNFPRLTLVLTGTDRVELEVQSRAQTVELKSGDVLLVPSNCWDRPTSSTAATTITFLFGKRQTGISLIRQPAGAMVPSLTVKTHLATPSGAESLLLDALLAFVRSDPKSHEAQLLIQPLLHCYLRLLQAPVVDTQTGKAHQTFQNLCLYIQNHFQFPLTRESVADAFRVSPNHVSRLFRAQGFMRFNDYLNLVRIDRAKYLLRRHDLTVDEVALSCGYNETAYFCRAFKKRTSFTPTHFRAKYSNLPLENS